MLHNGPMAKKPTVTDVRQEKYLRSSTWSGLKVGDRVDVDKVPGRAQEFSFLAHVVNRSTGESWVEVVGGRAGTKAVRSFHPGQIFPKGALRSKGGALSLEDQPGLPLG